MAIESAAAARLEKVLDGLIRVDGVVSTRKAFIERQPALVASVSDGKIDYSRRKFNSMNYQEQRAYEARLSAKRYYWINNIMMPKIVFDWALKLPGCTMAANSL